MKDYGTLENYIRSYGGAVETKKHESPLKKDKKISLSFGRSIIFPRHMIEKYDPVYQEEDHVPKLTPTKAEQKLIQDQFDDIKAVEDLAKE